MVSRWWALGLCHQSHSYLLTWGFTAFCLGIRGFAVPALQLALHIHSVNWCWQWKTGCFSPSCWANPLATTQMLLIYKSNLCLTLNSRFNFNWLLFIDSFHHKVMHACDSMREWCDLAARARQTRHYSLLAATRAWDVCVTMTVCT